MTQATETEKEICYLIGQELPTRSRADSDMTKKDIQELYVRFSLVCPDYEYMIP